jgi:hypothetical protein
MDAAGGHAGAVEAIPRLAAPPLTFRRFPSPRRADKIAGGYVVRDATGQALAYLYARENEDEARQARVLTGDEAGASRSRLPDYPSCLGRRSATDTRRMPAPGPL